MDLYSKRHFDFNNPLDKSYVLYGCDGKVIPKYQEIKKINDHLFKVKKDGLFGLVDEEDNTLVDCIYEEIGNFNEGMCKVKREGKYGFLSEMFVETIPCEYLKADDFKNGLAKVCYLPVGTTFIDKHKKARVALVDPFDDVSDVVGGLIQIRRQLHSVFITDKNEPFEDFKKYYEVYFDGDYWYGETSYIKYKFNKHFKEQIFTTQDDENVTYDDWLRQN